KAIITCSLGNRCISDRFDVGKATTWRAVRRVVNALYLFLYTFIKWPIKEEAEQTWNIVKDKCGFPKVIRAIDGTHIRIAAHKIYPEAYINRKGYHSIQLQVICDSNLKFIHCYTGQMGSVNDARVFKLSGVYDLCTENYFYDNSHILMMQHTIDPCVIVPFKDNGHLTESQVKYNTCHAQSRIMVERAFGLLKDRFRSILDKLSMTRTYLIPKYIIVCCILHNIYILQKDFIEISFIVNEPQFTLHNDINNIERRNQGIEK
ncbi:uncharacterized protein LOC126858702, partial [Cataglyphis hispanica]|uniref:uncharacterized protein LOC126858702 n=1 Tax=Cataglyphis hispanica TaxID=1086592 RepID=UPI00217F37E9